jgi:hypothetical protein
MEIDIRLVHLAEELPRVRRKRLDVAPLPFSEMVSNAGLGLPDPD